MGEAVTVSTETSYSISLNEIIDEAFDVIGVGAEGETVNADMYARAKRSLNLMLKSWNAIDNLWRQTEGYILLVDGQSGYSAGSLSPKPMRVSSIRRLQVDSGYETPMTQWSRQEYFDMPNKSVSPSTPVNWYFDPQRDEGVIYVWPCPTVEVAYVNRLRLTYLRQMFIMDSSADTLDFPEEWQEAVVMNLAKALMLKYPVNDTTIASMVIDRADSLFARLKAWDNETASIYLMTDDRYGDAWR
jgi:hypothetical protein